MIYRSSCPRKGSVDKGGGIQVGWCDETLVDSIIVLVVNTGGESEVLYADQNVEETNKKYKLTL